MPDHPGDVRKKLDDMYRKTEDLRLNLIEIHNMLTNSGFFHTPPQPQPAYVPPQPVAQPDPPPIQQVQRPVQQAQQQVPPVPSPQYHAPKPPAKEKLFFERHPDLEKFIGERLVTFIGIAILVTGIAFFVKYAIDQNWINETGRTAIGILCGGILIAVAHRLRKSYTTFSSVLAGGGIATLYFTISYAFQVYHLFSQPVALSLLVVVTLFTVLLSIGYDRKELAVVAIVGGFASPLMVKTGEGNFVVLCIYMLILDAGMLVLAYYKKWNVINVLSFAFTLLFYGVALQKDIIRNQHAHDYAAFLFATLFYLVFFAMNIVNNIRARRAFDSFEILSLLSNTGLYYGAGFFLLRHMEAQHLYGLFTLAVAAFNFGFAYALYKRQEVDRNLVYFLVGIVITFVSLAGPVQLNGNHITLFWAAEAVFLYWFYTKSRLIIIRRFSIILNLVLVLSVAYNWMNVYLTSGTDLTLFVNKGLITTLGAVISLGLTSGLLLRSKELYIAGSWLREEYRRLLSTAAVVILFIGGFLELNHQLTVVALGREAIVIANSTYILAFLALTWFSLPMLKMEYFRWTARIGILAVMIFSVAIPHIYVSEIRNLWLMGHEKTFGPFLLHYVYVVMLCVLSYVVFRDAQNNKTTSREFSGFMLWLFSAVIVFQLSAELDHTMVMAWCDNPDNPVWRAADVAGNISAGLTMSHKVGFPIIWGILSFVMMAIGMSRKNRQLRIISLVLFFATVVKLILLGVYGESQTGKIIAFILCGVILLLVSFMYQKLKKLIMYDTQHVDSNADENGT